MADPTPAEGHGARAVTSQLSGGTRAAGRRGLSPGGTRTLSLPAGNPAPAPWGHRDSAGLSSARGRGAGSQAEQAAGRVCFSAGGPGR